jgi:hypothetical protein
MRIYQWGTFPNFATLAAGTTPVDGDKAQVLIGGRSTQWQFDATLNVWRIQEGFPTTSGNGFILGNLPFPGMQQGDWVTCTDNGTKAQWTGSAYQFLS